MQPSMAPGPNKHSVGPSAEQLELIKNVKQEPGEDKAAEESKQPSQKQSQQQI